MRDAAGGGRASCCGLQGGARRLSSLDCNAMRCWCLAARPSSPGAELVRKAGAGGAPGPKSARPEDAENQEHAENLIGTAVDPQSVERRPPIELGPQPHGLAPEGSTAPLLGEGKGGGGESEAAAAAAADGSGSEAAGERRRSAADAADAADAAAQDPAALLLEEGPDREEAADGEGAAADGEAAEAAAAAEGSSLHSCPGEEGSQAALLPAEVSLKQPRMSRISMLFSCSSTGAVADSGERHSQQQVRERAAPVPSPPPPGCWPPQMLPNDCPSDKRPPPSAQPIRPSSFPCAEHTWRQQQLRSGGQWRPAARRGAALRGSGR